jgi:anti-sigma regulatory factor (Ser/Thr protein kinase)
MEPLVVPGTLESLASIRDYVAAAAELAGLDERRSYRLRLAVDEIATNIVVHGYEEPGVAGDIEVRAQWSDGRLEIDLADWAALFDPLNRPRPDQLSVSLEDKPIGGLGIYLAIQNVDEFRYHCNDGRNHNIFIIRDAAAARPQPPESPGSRLSPSG